MAFYKKTPKDILIDLIKEANPDLPINLTATNCVLDKAVAKDGTVNGVVTDTECRVRGVDKEGWSGVMYVQYNRLQLQRFFFVNNSFQSFNARTIHDALPVINQKYGLNLTMADVQPTVLNNPGVPNYNQNVTITARTDSLMYLGSAALQLRRGVPFLNEAVTVTSLDAYRHPFVKDNKLSASMLTFGLDFSDYPNLLTVDASGMPNFAGLSAVMVAQGLPVWSAPANGNFVVDSATTAIDQSNKQYDRVVVHTGINEAGVSGTAYYHYNV